MKSLEKKSWQYVAEMKWISINTNQEVKNKL